MSGYLLFLPDAHGYDPVRLDERGLASLRADRNAEFADCLNGPSGYGLFAHWHNKGETMPLDASLYDWTPAPADKAAGRPAKRFWLGVPRGQKVTPDAIQRDVQRSGYWLTLADGNQWHIPAAAQLPHRHGLSEEGEHIRKVHEQFQDYWQKSEQFAVQMFQALDTVELLAAKGKNVGEQTVEFTLKDTWDFCCQALSINYRLCPEIVSMLGLIDDDAMSNIVKAAIDLPCLIDLKKKDDKANRVGISVGLSG